MGKRVVVRYLLTEAKVRYLLAKKFTDEIIRALVSRHRHE